MAVGMSEQPALGMIEEVVGVALGQNAAVSEPCGPGSRNEVPFLRIVRKVQTDPAGVMPDPQDC